MLYQFRLNRYLKKDLEIDILISYFRKKNGLNRAQFAEIINAPKSTIKTNEEHYINTKIIQNSIEFFNLKLDIDPSIVKGMEDLLNNIYMHFVYMNATRAQELFEELVNTYQDKVKNTVLEIFIPFAQFITYGFLNNNTLASKMEEAYNTIQPFEDYLFDDHKAILYDGMILLYKYQGGMKKKEIMEYVNKITPILPIALEPVFYYHYATSLREMGNFFESLFYCRKAIPLLDVTNNIIRLTAIKVTYINDYICLGDYLSANEIVNSFLDYIEVNQEVSLINPHSIYLYKGFLEYFANNYTNSSYYFTLSLKYTKYPMESYIMLILLGYKENKTLDIRSMTDAVVWEGYQMIIDYFYAVNIDCDKPMLKLLYNSLKGIKNRIIYSPLINVIDKEYEESI